MNLLRMPPADQPPEPDTFHWLVEMNKASAVMLVERAVIAPALGRTIAQAIAEVAAQGAQPGGARPGDYLEFEKRLVAIAGPDVSRLHTGRSRQDLGATLQRLALRHEFLHVFARLNAARAALLDLAAQYPHAVIPAYTWGVQAQPLTLGHYLLGFLGAFGRLAERMREAYPRINRSPFGTAAMGTSSFDVDRLQLAELLGFDGLVENSFDAGQIAPIDLGAELAGLASSCGLTIGAFVADLTTQYAQTRPWLLLMPGAQTGGSSIMPQKRNPFGLTFLRGRASRLIASAQAFTLAAHNVATGMGDYKPFIDPEQGNQPHATVELMALVLDSLTEIVGTLQFDPARARQEVDNEYATMTELADVLQRDGNVPFRIGHHFAARLVDHLRASAQRSSEIAFAEAQRIWRDVADELNFEIRALPLSEVSFRRALDADHMVQASKGIGGPQASEVERMLGAARSGIDTDRQWQKARVENLVGAKKGLEDYFERLARS
ncbi:MULTISPECIES: lyase family protein [unclassified Beijerinckia]|uniref:lyase family protein n=1 Tax=unclassified Beijerinckia TaxID=2638183 RepID=UPI00089B34E0|nr:MULTISPECIES: lyase family protein [unclassified Beijerinckia]MDH7797187.1 argininosuccinate lyase [Beijerinckia sp. GAS462]SEC75686.1 argininosuccinate lyase [Beijerinckia sp. 28-YEA-48]